MSRLFFVFLYDLLQILRTDFPFDMDEAAIVARGVEQDFPNVILLNFEKHLCASACLVAGDDRLKCRILERG